MRRALTTIALAATITTQAAAQEIRRPMIAEAIDTTTSTLTQTAVRAYHTPRRPLTTLQQTAPHDTLLAQIDTLETRILERAAQETTAEKIMAYIHWTREYAEYFSDLYGTSTPPFRVAGSQAQVLTAFKDMYPHYDTHPKDARKLRNRYRGVLHEIPAAMTYDNTIYPNLLSKADPRDVSAHEAAHIVLGAVLDEIGLEYPAKQPYWRAAVEGAATALEVRARIHDEHPGADKNQLHAAVENRLAKNLLGNAPYASRYCGTIAYGEYGMAYNQALKNHTATDHTTPLEARAATAAFILLLPRHEGYEEACTPSAASQK